LCQCQLTVGWSSLRLAVLEQQGLDAAAEKQALAGEVQRLQHTLDAARAALAAALQAANEHERDSPAQVGASNHHSHVSQRQFSLAWQVACMPNSQGNSVCFLSQSLTGTGDPLVGAGPESTRSTALQDSADSLAGQVAQLQAAHTAALESLRQQTASGAEQLANQARGPAPVHQQPSRSSLSRHLHVWF